MRIVCLLGSPRAGGNSDILADAFLEAAEARGASVARHALRDLRFDGPNGMKPDPAGGYGSDDDMAPVLADVEQSDIVVFATPVYFCNMTGLMKQAFDRFFTFFVPDYVTAAQPSRLADGKKFLMIQTQGEGDDRYADLLDQYAPALDKLGFETRAVIRATGVREPGDVEGKPAMEDAKALARTWVQT